MGTGGVMNKKQWALVIAGIVAFLVIGATASYGMSMIDKTEAKLEKVNSRVQR
jgi:hypothetical protein